MEYLEKKIEEKQTMDVPLCITDVNAFETTTKKKCR